MDITTYGYRLPEAGDKAKGASGWYQSYEFNVERFDAHNHDGANSALLNLNSLTPYSQPVTIAPTIGTPGCTGWAAAGTGYSQTVTVPAGVTEVNDYNVKFIFTAPAARVGEIAYLNYDRVTATSYLVYCNDNTAEFTALYR